MPYPAKIHPETIENAALRIVEEEGWEALSMRRLAKGLGVRPSSLYNHYADRAALERALAKRATQTLFELLAPQAGKLKEMGRVYVAFAEANPALYHLLAETLSGEEGSEEGKALWQLLLNAVGKLSRDADDTSGAVAFWSFLHGYVALQKAGKFGSSGPQGGLERGLEALARGLKNKGNIL